MRAAGMEPGQVGGGADPLFGSQEAQYELSLPGLRAAAFNRHWINLPPNVANHWPSARSIEMTWGPAFSGPFMLDPNQSSAVQPNARPSMVNAREQAGVQSISGLVLGAP